jgi:hypothetical protein
MQLDEKIYGFTCYLLLMIFCIDRCFCDLSFVAASWAFELNGCEISLLQLLVLMLNLLGA